MERPDTRHIILTSLTLYGVWKAVGFKPDLHMEVETIPGACDRDLLVVLKAMYLHGLSTKNGYCCCLWDKLYWGGTISP